MFAARFRGERPVYGLRGVGLRAEGNLGRWRTMRDLGDDLVAEIQRRFPDDAYFIAGYSFGASMAFETVRLMEERGLPVKGLYLIAPMPLDFYSFGPFRLQIDGLRRPVSELSGREALRLYATLQPPPHTKALPACLAPARHRALAPPPVRHRSVEEAGRVSADRTHPLCRRPGRPISTARNLPARCAFVRPPSFSTPPNQPPMPPPPGAPFSEVHSPSTPFPTRISARNRWRAARREILRHLSDLGRP